MQMDPGHGGAADGGMAGGHDAPALPVKIEQLTPTHPSNKRVRLRYGPIIAPLWNDTSGMGGHHGMADEGGIKHFNILNTLKPCDACILKYGSANLEYVNRTSCDGSPEIANYNTGVWLHHYSLSVQGPGRSDLFCGSKKDGERIMAVHNDRNATYYGSGFDDKAGYFIRPEDTIDVELEIKNDIDTLTPVYFTTEFEFVPLSTEDANKTPKELGYKEVKALWLDAASCDDMGSEILAPLNTTKFTLEGAPWTASFAGSLITTVGHMHDGGVHLEVFRDGEQVCNSLTTYGGSEEYIPRKETIAAGAPDTVHVSSFGACHDFGKFEKGDNITLKAHYDFDKYPGGRNLKNNLSGLMGIAVIILGVDESSSFHGMYPCCFWVDEDCPRDVEQLGDACDEHMMLGGYMSMPDDIDLMPHRQRQDLQHCSQCEELEWLGLSELLPLIDTKSLDRPLSSDPKSSPLDHRRPFFGGGRLHAPDDVSPAGIPRQVEPRLRVLGELLEGKRRREIEGRGRYSLLEIARRESKRAGPLDKSERRRMSVVILTTLAGEWDVD
ncbi:hypothetical protein P152DRAFT_475087 [Eremomyces bilateralis CBS 781.70]|uniref:Uncharacterized protein n=1 Tax=Eremomyces bilateralis CBS 781.70 TaxID=1392243 RepID=A0A6G1FZ20_9PEZI|nr:uncharacterized protein P152DRAFT_475087 [Eremomyces bilateralis CBS 781.70]KAF1811034.1 hypothetical protein P152DRAFT_475087 [Eremomyces bilateralis CBS 781.70]